jgi:two-component system NtrC family response regulator
LTVTDEALALILRYAWPGNVRQLENAIERVVVLANGDSIKPEELPQEVRDSESRIAKIDLKLPDEGIDPERVEREILSQALQKLGGNQTRAAQYLNISRKTLIYRMEKFGLIFPAADETDASLSNS